MTRELFVSSTPHETKVGLVEEDQLAEVYLERENEYTLAGSIYKGRVTRVLPGMQSAFVDIGLERDAFLYVTDFLELEDQEDTDEVERAASHGDTVRQENGGRRDGRSEGRSESRSEGRDRSERRDRGRRGEPRMQAEPSAQPASLEFSPLASGEMLIEGGDFGGGFAVEESAAVEPVSGESSIQEQIDEQGPRRWRGRRRRRGGRS